MTYLTPTGGGLFTHIEEVSVYNEASLRILRAPLLITIDYATKQMVIKGIFSPP